MKISDKKFAKRSDKQHEPVPANLVRAALNPLAAAEQLFDKIAQFDAMSPELGVAPPEPKKELVPIHEGMWDPSKIKREFRKMRQTGLTDENQAIDRAVDLGAAGAGADDQMVRNYLRVLWYHSMSQTPFKEWLYRRADVNDKYQTCLTCDGSGSVESFTDEWDAAGEAHFTKDKLVMCPDCNGAGVAICDSCLDTPAMLGSDICKECAELEKSSGMGGDTLSGEEIPGTGKIGQLDPSQSPSGDMQQGAPAGSPMPGAPPSGDPAPTPDEIFDTKSDLPLDEALQQLQESAEAVVDKVNNGETILDGKPMEPISTDTGATPAPSPKLAQVDPEDDKKPHVPDMMLKDNKAPDAAKSLTMSSLVEKMRAIQDRLKGIQPPAEPKKKDEKGGKPGTRSESATAKLNRIFGDRYKRLSDEYGAGVAQVEFMHDFIKETYGKHEDKLPISLVMKLKHADDNLLLSLPPQDLKLAFETLKQIDDEVASRAKYDHASPSQTTLQKNQLPKVKTAPVPEVAIGESKKQKFKELSDKLKEELKPNIKRDPTGGGAADPSTPEAQAMLIKQKLEQLLKKQVAPDVVKSKDVKPHDSPSLGELNKALFPSRKIEKPEKSVQHMRIREPGKPSSDEYVPEKSNIEKESVDQNAKEYWHDAYGSYGDQMTKDRVAAIADIVDETFDAYGIKLSASEFADVVSFISDDSDSEGLYNKVAAVKVSDAEFANIVDRILTSHIASTLSYKQGLPKFTKSSMFTLAVHHAGAREGVMKYVAEKMKTPKPAGSQGDSIKVEKLKDEAKDSKPTNRSDFIEFKVDDSFIQGDYVHLKISWKKDDASKKSEEGIKQAIISFIKGLESHKENVNLGFVGKIHVIDVDSNKAEVKFRASNAGDAVNLVREDE